MIKNYHICSIFLFELKKENWGKYYKITAVFKKILCSKSISPRGATTLSIMTISIQAFYVTLSLIMLCHYNAECCVLFIIMLNVVLLSVVAPTVVMEQQCFKNVSNCLSTNNYSYLETPFYKNSKYIVNSNIDNQAIFQVKHPRYTNTQTGSFCLEYLHNIWFSSTS